MSTLRINNIEAQSIPASPTIDEKVKVTNSSGDILVNIDGKTSGITTIGINTTDGNIKFDANSNVLITGILTATTLSGNFTPTSLEIGSNIKLGNAGVITATSFSGAVSGTTGSFSGQVNVGSNIKLGTAGVVTATSFVGSGANLTGITQTTINNNASTKFITGSGSANTLDCEANLSYNNSLVTFSSSNFLVDKGTNPTITAKETAGNKEVQLRANTTGGLLRTAGSYPLVLGTNQTERLRIDSSGRLLISTTSAGEADSSADDLVIGNTGSGNSGLTIVTGTGNNAAVFCADSGGTVRGGFRYQHSSDVLQFYSGGSVSLQVKSNGIGLHENYPVANSLTIRGAATDDTPLLVLKRHTDGAQSDGEIIGKIQFMSNENNVDSGNHQPRAEIHGVTVNTSGAAKMDFYTVPNSTTTPVKAMTINQLGQVTKPNQPSFLAEHQHADGSPKQKGELLNQFIRNFTLVRHNTGNCYSNSTGKFTAPVDGMYLFHIDLTMDGGDGQDDSAGCYFRVENNSANYNRTHGGVRDFHSVNPRYHTTANGYEMNSSFQTIEKLAAGATVGWYFTDWDHTGTRITTAFLSGYKLG